MEELHKLYEVYSEYIDRIQAEEGLTDSWAMMSYGEEYGARKYSQIEFEERLARDEYFRGYFTNKLK